MDPAVLFGIWALGLEGVGWLQNKGQVNIGHPMFNHGGWITDKNPIPSMGRTKYFYLDERLTFMGFHGR